MHTCSECIPCFLQQIIEASRRSGADPEMEQTILRRVTERLSRVDFSLTPPETARELHGIVREITGTQDAYASAKVECNAMAMELVPFLRDKIAASPAPLETAIRAAIAGNIIDFGVYGAHRDMSLKSAVEEALRVPLAVDDLQELLTRLRDAKRVLILCDNTGEIVCDKLLVEAIGPERVICAVKSRPILNDALMEDARAVGLTDVVTVIENGMDLPGLVLERATPEFRKVFDNADVIISKGQGNFETLNRLRRDGLFFLLRAKCMIVARELGVDVGGLIVKASRTPCAKTSSRA